MVAIASTGGRWLSASAAASGTALALRTIRLAAAEARALRTRSTSGVSSAHRPGCPPTAGGRAAADPVGEDADRWGWSAGAVLASWSPLSVSDARQGGDARDRPPQSILGLRWSPVGIAVVVAGHLMHQRDGAPLGG